MKLKTSIILSQILLTGLALGFTNVSAAADAKNKSGDATTTTPELKQDMADMYSKMGECMKTDKSMAECQKDVMKDCQVMKKTGHCPIMEGTKPMMGKGKMGSKMGSKMKGMGQGMQPGMDNSGQ